MCFSVAYAYEHAVTKHLSSFTTMFAGCLGFGQHRGGQRQAERYGIESPGPHAPPQAARPANNSCLNAKERYLDSVQLLQVTLPPCTEASKLEDIGASRISGALRKRYGDASQKTDVLLKLACVSYMYSSFE